ncbi:MAG: NADP-dependent malic enzyme, partial [Christensenellales bacterium]
VTDGTAVLGLGDIGPEAGMPVMEGKCVLFKAFGGVDAIPICVRSKDPDEIVKAVSLIAGSFGGINLEDISSPRCFEIEEKLKKCTDIPIFHDDQHGTAIVVAAAVINALKLVKKELGKVHTVINGAGSAGIAVCKLLLKMGLENIIMCDKKGVIHTGMEELNPAQSDLAKRTNKEGLNGTLQDALKGADIFIGVSAGSLLTRNDIAAMSPDSIIFAMANPVPEIMPDEAKIGGARVAGTGRSDFPNQINNVLAFPGVFRGALDARASDINEEMKIAAAYAIASLIEEEELNEDYIIPSTLDNRVAETVAKAVAEAAYRTNVAHFE